MKKRSILLITMLVLTILFLSSCQNCGSDIPAETIETPESNTVDLSQTCEKIYPISALVQEQTLADHDKQVSKDNDKWENNWTASKVSPTAQIKIGITKGATANFVEEYNGVSAVGIDSTRTDKPISIILRLADDETFNQNNCVLNMSSERTYKGIESGAIGSGMLIVEKSYDQTTWSRMDSEEYQNGLFTTNLRAHYGIGNDVLIYEPAGADLNHGIYLRVTFVYEAKHTFMGKTLFGGEKEETVDKIFREQSVFYLCNENIDGVTFHNLSIDNKNFPDEIKNPEGDVIEEYKRAETLIDGTMTVTGFELDNPMNNVTVTIDRNGQLIDVPTNGKVTETGVYHITISQKLGQKQKHMTVYIDKRSIEEIKSYYFSDGFVTGKRIYWEGQFPMFEGGYTTYSVSKTDENFPAIYGTITNLTTGTTIEIPAFRNQATGDLLEAGEYVATFYNNPTFNQETPAGDTIVITYRFMLIAQGTAPGPQVNKQSLAEYASQNVSDYTPKYYGVTFASASSGNITLAFSNYQDAFAYAYNYEKGCVEKQSDGSFRYSGTLRVEAKEKYNSLWDLTDATNYFAEQAVQVLFFDLTDDFTYLTLEDSIIESYDNLRTLELKKSIVIFESNEQRLAATAGNLLPVISAKKYQYLTPGLNGEVATGFHNFEFVKDENGFDSDSVVIVDCTGKSIPIQYHMSVAQQLQEANCATGVITVMEKTIYGDSTTYQAIYIAEGQNTTTATISYYKNGQTNTLAVSQQNLPARLEVNGFYFSALKDDLDPQAFVKVTLNGQETLYTFEEALATTWGAVGNYTVEFINRLGYAYQIEFSIEQSYIVTVSFSGAGAESLTPIKITNIQNQVALPQVSRYGYQLIGYEDQEGKQYTTVIDQVKLGKDLVLTPLWKAKTFTLTIQDSAGVVLQTTDVKFGETYILTAPLVSGDSVFEGWLVNGEKYEKNEVTIDTEENLIIVAVIHTTQNSNGTDSNKPAGGLSALPWIILLAGLIFAMGGFLVGNQGKVKFSKYEFGKLLNIKSFAGKCFWIGVALVVIGLIVLLVLL